MPLVPQRLGPPAPSPLITAQEARRRHATLRVYCSLCQRNAARPAGEAIPERYKAVAIGELWLQGRFRCSSCGRPADCLEVRNSDPLNYPQVLETWSLTEPYAAERLRRWWRHSEGGGRGRNWARFFGR